MRRFLPGRHFVPLLLALLPRRVAYTSIRPLPSRGPRSVASDSYAIARTKRLSFDITAFVEGPLGVPPPLATDTISVSCARAAVTSCLGRAPADVAAVATRTASSASAAMAARSVGEDIDRERTGFGGTGGGASCETNP